MEFIDIIKKRYATKQFTGEKLSQEKVDQLLEMIQLAPSSFGLQPYKIIVISDKVTKEKLRPVSYDQPQITTCSHLLVFCADSDASRRLDEYCDLMVASGVPQEKVDGMKNMMSGFLAGMDTDHQLTWAQRQAYIALGNALNGATALGFDSCPMEGFSSEDYSTMLDLPNHLVPTALVAIGVAADKPHQKIRFDDLFEKR